MQRREFCKLIGVSAAVKAVGVAAAEEKSNPYVPVTDSLVLRKLDQWQDWKFGFMMHWGTYSQWCVVESGSICSEDWIKRPAGIDTRGRVRRPAASGPAPSPLASPALRSLAGRFFLAAANADACGMNRVHRSKDHGQGIV